MDIKINMMVEFTVTEPGLEDALDEYDELTVEGMISEILDKSIAVDEIDCKVIAGPDTLEEVDELRAASKTGCVDST